MEKAKISFGVSGIPVSTKPSNYINGLKKVAELGLDAFELPFVRFVTMSEETAHAFRKENQLIAEQTGKQIRISVHAPYYINLNALDPQKIDESIERILKSVQRGGTAGAESIVFHPGFYVQKSLEESYHTMQSSITLLLKKLEKSMPNQAMRPSLRPETTGRVNQFGSMAELIKLANEFEDFLPCVDFAHLHARSNGGVNTYDEVMYILDELHSGIGERALKQMHIHYSGIEYTAKGERRHIPLKESDAAYDAVLKALKNAKVEGVIICESLAQEQDALLLKETYFMLPDDGRI